MALALREVMIVLRAKDQASKIIGGVAGSVAALGNSGQLTGGQLMGIGSALTGAGIAITAVGALGVKFFLDATGAASSYNQQVASTKTQVDGVKASMAQLRDLGLEVAKKFPVAFEQIQPTLYDIFSSTNANLTQARILLTQFSKDSVAGQVDLQSAARATMGIMNAYNIPLEKVKTVSDIMFQLVRKGVGTYQEFTSAIGRSVPAAVAANQTIQTLTGSIAFLTRNGLSAAMASTSTARAMELMTKPDVTAALEKMGVSTKDASGNFRQMNDIVTQLAVNKGWDKMTGPQLKQAFHDTFGTGSIQARRFFDIALKNFPQLNQMIGSMNGAAGAAGKAYDIMFKQPQSQVKLMQNRIHAYVVEIGEKLLPIKLKLLQIGERVLKWWDSLSPTVQNATIYVGLFIAALALIIGPILIIAGLLITLVGALVLMGATVGTAVAIIVGFIVIMALLVAALFGVALNWDSVSKALSGGWDAIQSAAGAAVDWLTQRYNSFIADVKHIWNQVKGPVLAAMADIKSIVVAVQTSIETWWAAHGASLVKQIQSTWDSISGTVRAAWNVIKDIVMVAVVVIAAVAIGLFTLIKAAWDNGGSQIIGVVVSVFQGILDTIQGVVTVIGGILTFLDDLFHGRWGKLWGDVRTIFSGAWQAIIGLFFSVLGTIGKIIAMLGAIVTNLLSKAWHEVEDLTGGFVDSVITFFQNLPGQILDALGSLADTLGSFFIDAFNTIIDAAWSFAQKLPEYIGYAVGGAILAVALMPAILFGLIVIAVLEMVRAIITYGPRILSEINKIFFQVIAFLGTLPGILFSLGLTAITFLWNGMMQIWNGLLGWIQTLPGAIWSFLERMVPLLLQAGIDALNSLYQGMMNIWTGTILPFLGSIPGAVVGFLDGARGWLVGIGNQILHGLLDGLKQAWEDVKSFVGGIADRIRHLKGPPAYDAILLVDNGKLVMQSLQKGMKSEWVNTVAMMRDMTGDIEATLSPTVNGTANTTSKYGSSSIQMQPGAVVVSIQGDANEATIKAAGEMVETKLMAVVQALNSRN